MIITLTTLCLAIIAFLSTRKYKNRFQPIALGYSRIDSVYRCQMVEVNINRLGRILLIFDDLFCDPVKSNRKGYFRIDTQRLIEIVGIDNAQATINRIKDLLGSHASAVYLADPLPRKEETIVDGPTLPLDTLLTAGFGEVFVTRNGKRVYKDGQSTEQWTLNDAEKIAAKQPKSKWEITLNSPFNFQRYRRKSPAKWVLVSVNTGFA